MVLEISNVNNDEHASEEVNEQWYFYIYFFSCFEVDDNSHPGSLDMPKCPLSRLLEISILQIL